MKKWKTEKCGTNTPPETIPENAPIAEMKKYYYVVYVHKDGTGCTTVETINREFNPYKFRKEYKNKVVKSDLIVTNWIEISKEVYNSIQEYL